MKETIILFLSVKRAANEPERGRVNNSLLIVTIVENNLNLKPSHSASTFLKIVIL